ncbi:LexA family protein [Paenibacillus alvei]|uniref:LexA family protein n=1 Tax=Paenibacillus alvei TaxID=44250 RepID=UPI0013DB8CEF|nr:S24 family peptidase [Paenibacillus alvei]NEZ40740.1 helix-turn-helix domain-containing protein [Paenibacillus alvei]
MVRDELDSMGKRLRFMREFRGYTQGDMADKLELTSANISSYERDKSAPPSLVLAKICDLLNTSADYLLLRKDSYLQHAEDKSIPLINTVHADLVTKSESHQTQILYPFPQGQQPDFCIRIQDDSMIEAGIKNGDIVFLRKEKWAEYNGQIVAVIINGEPGTLKRMQWFEGSPFIRLTPENKHLDYIEVLPSDIRVIGVYAGHFSPEVLSN